MSTKRKKYYLRKSCMIIVQKDDLCVKKRQCKILHNIEINVNCVVLSDEHVLLNTILLFLEQITGHKALGEGIYKYIGAAKKFFFSGGLILRNKIMENFLLYLRVCCLPVYYKRNGFITGVVQKNVYLLRVIDFNIFPNCNLNNIIGSFIIKFRGSQDTREVILEEYLKLIKIK